MSGFDLFDGEGLEAEHIQRAQILRKLDAMGKPKKPKTKEEEYEEAGRWVVAGIIILVVVAIFCYVFLWKIPAQEREQEARDVRARAAEREAKQEAEERAVIEEYRKYPHRFAPNSR